MMFDGCVAHVRIEDCVISRVKKTEFSVRCPRGGLGERGRGEGGSWGPEGERRRRKQDDYNLKATEDRCVRLPGRLSAVDGMVRLHFAAGQADLKEIALRPGALNIIAKNLSLAVMGHFSGVAKLFDDFFPCHSDADF